MQGPTQTTLKLLHRHKYQMQTSQVNSASLSEVKQAADPYNGNFILSAQSYFHG
jgi:hypothetical protein